MLVVYRSRDEETYQTAIGTYLKIIKSIRKDRRLIN